jgi:hypothetical protein
MKRWICFAVAVSLVGAIFAPSQSAKADEQGWGIVMRGPESGIMYLYVTSEGFALVMKETGATFVSHAPDWRMVMYNDTTHVYYTEPLSNFSLTQDGQQAAKHTTQTARAEGTGTIAGLPVTKYLVTTTSEEYGTKDSQVWATTRIVAPEQLKRTFRKVFSIEMGTGVGFKGWPVKVTSTTRSGNPCIVYETLSAKQQMIHTGSFNYPASYRRVDSEMAVLLDEERQKKINSVLEDTSDLNDILNSATSSSSSRPAATGGRTPAQYRPAPNNNNYHPPRNLNTAPAATTKKDDFNDLLKTLGR